MILGGQIFGHLERRRIRRPMWKNWHQAGVVITSFTCLRRFVRRRGLRCWTGCYPGRHKVYGAIPPRAQGLDPSFATIAEVLKPVGYATGVFGKWHIGDHEDTRPPARGFDESSGLMYSNDMWKYHPQSRYFDTMELQFWKNGEIVIDDVSPEQQKMLTTWYTEHAVDFIGRHADEPFFLYVPHSMPHVPLFCSDKFDGKSGEGLYADVMMEIDWSVGEIMNALEEAGVADDTVVVFTSDNGPWISYGNHAGKTPYREAKGTGFDGGTRSGVCDALSQWYSRGRDITSSILFGGFFADVCEVSGGGFAGLYD